MDVTPTALDDKVIEIADHLADSSSIDNYPEAAEVFAKSEMLQSVSEFTARYVQKLEEPVVVGVLSGLVLMGIEIGRFAFGHDGEET